MLLACFVERAIACLRLHAFRNRRRTRNTVWLRSDKLFGKRTQDLPVKAGRPTLRRECGITLLEVLFCVGPAMAAIYRGNASMAAMWLYGTAAAILGVHVLARQPKRYISFAISIIPAILLMRNQYLYSSLVAIFAMGLLLWWALCPSEVWNLWGHGVRLTFVLACIMYWVASW